MKLLGITVTMAMMICSFAAYADDGASQPQDETATAEQKSFLDDTDTILGADPKTIIEARKKIIRNSAAQRVPLVVTTEEISEPLMAIEETFDVTSEPSSQSPILNIARYMNTSVNFVDAYGNPWPIKKTTSALEGIVSVTPVADPSIEETSDQSKRASAGGISLDDPQAGSVDLSALKHGAAGNVTVYLVGRTRPITLMLEGQSGVFHKEATIKLSEVGPQTDLKKINRADEVVVGTRTDADLNNALYGVGPVGSKPMVVEGGEGRVWIKGPWMYMQTPLSVFSPRVEGTSHANGKYRAYKLPSSTVVMASNEEGKTVTLKIKRIAQEDALSEAMSGSAN